jgi:hypothetical protein
MEASRDAAFRRDLKRPGTADAIRLGWTTEVVVASL